MKTFNAIKAPTGIARDDSEKMVEGHHADIPESKLSVPQIYIEGEVGSRSCIGGFNELDAWYLKQAMKDGREYIVPYCTDFICFDRDTIPSLAVVMAQ